MNRLASKTIFQITTALGLVSICAGFDDALANNISNAEAQTEVAESQSTAISYEPLLVERTNSPIGVGLAVVIVDGDDQNFVTTGFASKDTSKQIDKDSLFEIGSITKTFTTIILADMVIKGEVSLDDPAAKYLPENVSMPSYDGPDGEGREITLKDLATHSSSLPALPDNISPADPLNPYVDYTSDLLYAFLSNHKLTKPIGSEVAYSNLAMGLLGHILELRSGLSYEQLVTQRILKPLNMHNTYMTIPDDQKPYFVVGHDAAGDSIKHWDFDALAGAGALRSNIKDMTHYLKANMGLIETPLAQAMALSHKIQRSFDGSSNFIGLGWITQKTDAQNMVWHNGGTYGFRSFLGFDPERKRGVVVLANSQDNPDLIGSAILAKKPELLAIAEPNSELSFTAEQLEKYVGEYQLAPTFSINVSSNGSQLFIQATGQSKVAIYAKSKLEFFLEVVKASIIFEENDEGEITSLILDQGGIKRPAKKL